MKGTFTAAAILVVISALPVTLTAKEKTLKITVSGGNLATPVEITDPKILDNFNVWTGPGTSSNEDEGFIVQWSRGATAEPPSRLSRYLVSFYTERSRLILRALAASIRAPSGQTLPARASES
jgi:hypothetical protein